MKKTVFHELSLNDWQPSLNATEEAASVKALESGSILYFPKLIFPLQVQEHALLTPACLKGKSKNISYTPQTKTIKGSVCKGVQETALRDMMARFAQQSQVLLTTLIPHYKNHLIIGRTSFRPAEIKGRTSSVRKDDTRLHVDAFPATPTQGKRIVRVFSNINPHNEDRVWNVGEPFEQVVNYFKHKLKKPLPGVRCLLSCFKITKSYRTLYDHYMLALHNKMKESEQYQQTVSKQTFHFPAGSSWIVMTDQVSHAALKGQHVLEQTFYLPVEGMCYPECAPLRVLGTFFRLDNKS